uniref:Uncharacterized protein n=1 Tax=Hyaloperonospora arabidopsidis (strain Emoy2) TaxID=559515 RepID=M4BTJ7_HYAAE
MGRWLLTVDTPESPVSPRSKRRRLNRRRAQSYRARLASSSSDPLQLLFENRQQQAITAARRHNETEADTQARHAQDSQSTAARRHNETEAEPKQDMLEIWTIS